jgi:hypothetical protein
VMDFLPSKHKALSVNLSTAKKKKKKLKYLPIPVTVLGMETNKTEFLYSKNSESGRQAR